jgi:putative DNA primase/helicase
MALPPEVRTVTIAADNDPSGRRAAREAAARWRAEGRTVRVAMPDKPGADFNDVLRERVAHG